MQNVGSYKGDNRPVYFDVNDFDEGLLAPASWDSVRMVTSLRLAAHSLEIKPSETKEPCENRGVFSPWPVFQCDVQ